MRSNVTYEPVRTSGTAVVIQEDVPKLEGCETFEFFVTASNDAGDSDPARIEETIPISPDVTSTSSSLSIDAVQIVNQSVSIVVSFKVCICSHWTIKCNEIECIRGILTLCDSSL